MSNAQAKFLTLLLREGDVSPATELGFKRSFLTGRFLSAYDYIQSHLVTHGKYPDEDRLKRDCDFTIVPTKGENLSEVVQDLSNLAKFDKAKDIALNLGMKLRNAKNTNNYHKAGPDIYSFLKESVLTLEEEFSPTRDISLKEEEYIDLFKKDYLSRKNNGGLAKVVWPWPTANTNTAGIEEGDLVAITGRPGTKKTTILVDLATFWWQSGLNVLFISNELTLTSLAYRQIARYLHLDPGQLRRAGYDFSSLETQLKGLQNMPSNYIICGADSDMGAGGVGFVASKIAKYKPDICIIDGAYLLSDDMGSKDKYQQAGNIVRYLKILNKKSKTPIVIAWQLNRGAQNGIATTANLGLTDNLGADASYAISLEQTVDQAISGIMVARFIKARNGPEFYVTLTCDFERQVFEEILPEEADVSFPEEEL